MSDFDEEIVDGFADAVFVSEWANAWDRLVEDEIVDDVPWPGGSEISDYAPPTPDEARDIAKSVLTDIEHHTGKTIDELYEEAEDSEYDAPGHAEEFGYQLGMTWLGHGIGAADAVIEATQGLHGEVMVEVDPETEEAEIVYSSTWPPPTNGKSTRTRRKGPGFEFLNNNPDDDRKWIVKHLVGKKTSRATRQQVRERFPPPTKQEVKKWNRDRPSDKLDVIDSYENRTGVPFASYVLQAGWQDAEGNLRLP